MGMTLTEKIIARAAGLPSAQPGMIVAVRVDRLMINDMLAPAVFRKFESLGAEAVVHPEHILVCLDHKVPPDTTAGADVCRSIREFCRAHGMQGFLEIGRHGIGHQVMCEGFTRPGEIAVGTDSHAPTYGGLGALGFGINSSDAAVAMASGKIWVRVPESIRVTFTGSLSGAATAKDVSLYMQNLGTGDFFNYKDLEISGPGAHALSVSSRLTIANMAAEMDIKACLFEPDEIVADYMGDSFGCDLRADEDARYAAAFEIDLHGIEPLVACPHSNKNIRPVREVRGMPIQQVVLGSCTNGRLEDLQQAAQILKGRTVHPNVRLIVVPASQKILTEATAQGVMETILRAGAVVLPPSCAGCGAFGPGKLGAGERCVSTTTRNFRGRIGSIDSEVFLSSAYTAAASAVAGYVEDPGKYL